MTLRQRGLVAVVALLLAACAPASAPAAGTASQAPAQSSATASAAAEKVTLTYWTHTFGAMNDLNKKLIADFEKQNPNVTIDYSVVPNDQFFTKMLTAMSTGTGPDVFNMSSTFISSYLASNVVAPVDPSAFGAKSQADLENGWTKGAFDLVTSDGKVYGIPNEYDVSAMALNKALFQAAGLDPNSPPKTWDDVIKYSRALVKTQNGQITQRGFDFYYLPNFYWLDFGNLSLQWGGHLLTPDGKASAINSPENAAALQWWRDFVFQHKLGGPQYSLKDATNPVSDFTSGKVAMFIVYPWAVSAIKQSPVWKDTAIVPLPQHDPAHPTSHLYGYYWMVGKASKHQAEAWKFVNFLSSHPDQWLTDVGFIQPKKGWTDSEAAKSFPFLNVWLDSEKIAQPGEQSTKMPQIRTVLQNMIESIMANGTDPKAALAQADQQINAALK